MYDTGYYATGYYATGYYSRLGIPLSLLSRTYQTLILEARELLGDDNEFWYRYPDSMLVSILNRGLNELDRIRPDAWYEQYLTGVPEVTDLTPSGAQISWTEPFAPELRFYPAVLHYVVAMTEASEDPYCESGDMQRHLDTFRMLVLRV